MMLHAKYLTSNPYTFFKHFPFGCYAFGCYGNQSSPWNEILLSNFVEDHHRIISVKFHQILPKFGFKEEVVLVTVDGRTTDDGQNSTLSFTQVS